MAEELHVVMLPWLAFGHMIPFLQLSQSLAKLGIRISFISTPRNIDRLPKISPQLAPWINLVKLPLPHVDNLPENAESTMDVTEDRVPYLKKAYDLLQQPYEQFLADESPDWVIHDFIPYWAPEIATKLGVHSAVFSILPASACVFYGPQESLTGEGRRWKMNSSPESLLSPPDCVPFPSALAIHRHEAAVIFDTGCCESASGVSDSERIARAVKACKVVGIRSCTEFEGEYLNLLKELYGKSIIQVGLLPRLPQTQYVSGIDVKSEWLELFKWLDERPSKSIVFVAFGSECGIARDQLTEIAFGLELSKLPFMWVLRKPHWAIDDVDILPLGFEDRTRGHGIVQMNWIPQLEILAHCAIGGCMIHGGWSSAIESLQHGHPIIVLPLGNDQPFNSKILVEKGLAVEVERNEGGFLSRHEVAKALRHVMVEEKGEDVVLKARQMKGLIPKWELHGDHIAGFARYLNTYKRINS